MKKLALVSLLVAIILAIIPLNASAQTQQSKPGKQFVTFYLDWTMTAPISFRELTLSKISGAPISVNSEDGRIIYSSPDGLTTITDIKFETATRGGGLMFYPFGSSDNSTTMAVKAGYETLPNIQFTVNPPSGQKIYELANGKAYDLGIGIRSSQRQPGHKLGASSFFLVGVGRIYEVGGTGQRYFAEGGGGLNFGAVGIGLVLKISQNQIPSMDFQKTYLGSIGLMTTLSF